MAFKGYKSRMLFPKDIQKILDLEWQYDPDKKIYVTKLPAPKGGNFGPTTGRLVYTTSKPIENAVQEFKERILKPLGLKGLAEITIRKKRTSNGSGKHYHQADTNYNHTYISLRSVTRN